MEVQSAPEIMYILNVPQTMGNQIWHIALQERGIQILQNCLGMTNYSRVKKFTVNNPLNCMTLMFQPFKAIFRGSIVKETCLTFAMNLSIIIYRVLMIKQVKIVDVSYRVFSSTSKRLLFV
jgi:hypothetical protein